MSRLLDVHFCRFDPVGMESRSFSDAKLGSFRLLSSIRLGSFLQASRRDEHVQGNDRKAEQTIKDGKCPRGQVEVKQLVNPIADEASFKCLLTGSPTEVILPRR